MTISPWDLEIVNRVLDDIRRQFPVREGFGYEDKIQEIIHKHIWDVLANLQFAYEKEAEYVGEKIAKEYEVKICEHCKGNIAIRNPTGFCDHLYYPDNCPVCKIANTIRYDPKFLNTNNKIAEEDK